MKKLVALVLFVPALVFGQVAPSPLIGDSPRCLMTGLCTITTKIDIWPTGHPELAGTYPPFNPLTDSSVVVSIPGSPVAYSFSGIDLTITQTLLGGAWLTAPVVRYAEPTPVVIPANIPITINVSVPATSSATYAFTLGPDTTPPGAPSSLTAVAVSQTQINLTWGQSTDNVAIAGYLVERCQGAACTAFAQVAAPTVLAYQDPGLAPATSYSYRVRSSDPAGNLSIYTNVASVTTQSPPPPPPSFTADCTKMPPAAQLVDKGGAVWTLLPRIGGIAGQTGAARNGVRVMNSVDFVTIKGGTVWDQDFGSGSGWEFWTGATVTESSTGPGC